jgi:hypothetical protein
LYRERAVDPTTLLQSFSDEYDVRSRSASATEIAVAILSDVPAALSHAILASYELLVVRLEALVAETTMMVENAVTTNPIRLKLNGVLNLPLDSAAERRIGTADARTEDACMEPFS